MTAPLLPFDPAWLRHPAVNTIVGTPGWISVAHELNRTHVRNGTRTSALVRGFGCGSPTRAYPSAVGELIERFGASDPRIVLELECNDPPGERMETALLHPITGADVSGGWIRATGVITGRTVWVPAALAVLWYEHSTGRRIDVTVDATGLAAGLSLETAVRHGLYEVIERDAVGLWWRSRRRTHRLVTPPAEFDHSARQAGLLLTTAVVDSSGCATVAIACVSRADGQEATLGSACRTDSDDALVHAVAEAFMVRATVASQIGSIPTGEVLAGVERLIWGWWHGPEILNRLHSPSGDVFVNIDKPIEILVQRVFGAEPLFVHLANIALENHLMSVARVFVPGAFRLESCLSGAAHVSARLSALGSSGGGPHPFG